MDPLRALATQSDHTPEDPPIVTDSDHSDDPILAVTESDLYAPVMPGMEGIPGPGAHPKLAPPTVTESEIENDPDSADYLVGDWFKPKPTRPLHSTRCVATVKSTGKRCKKWAVIGFTKCPAHSGYNNLANLQEYRERILERSRLDLLRLAPTAVATYEEIVSDPEVQAHVRLKAASEIFDRIGIRGGQELTIDATVTDGTLSPAEDIRARLDRLRSSAVSTVGELEPASSGDGRSSDSESEIVEAEVIEE